MRVKLIFLSGKSPAAQFHLKLPALLGRGRGASLTLPHPLISRQHCELYEREGRLRVRDLGSLNGTLINGLKISDPQDLIAGDTLTLGEVSFRVFPVVDEISSERLDEALSDDSFAADHLTDYDFGDELSSDLPLSDPSSDSGDSADR